jgi:SnoaL-like domain
VLRCGDEFVGFVQKVLAKAVTVHQAQQPEIDLLRATKAKGIWAMLHVVGFVPSLTMHGFGHYIEDYDKVDGRPCICSSILTRLRKEIRTLFIAVSSRRELAG